MPGKTASPVSGWNPLGVLLPHARAPPLIECVGAAGKRKIREHRSPGIPYRDPMGSHTPTLHLRLMGYPKGHANNVAASVRNVAAHFEA